MAAPFALTHLVCVRVCVCGVCVPGRLLCVDWTLTTPDVVCCLELQQRGKIVRWTLFCVNNGDDGANDAANARADATV